MEIDKGINEGEYIKSFELSHFELAHSMMSHQEWRNYTTVMEAELAAFKDLGYKNIDLRNYFGSSEYRDDQVYDNTNPYYARNENGDAYEQEVPNTTMLGVGLHIYGSNNQINQVANLYADGEAAVAIRNDGSSNTIQVAKDTKLTANGTSGTGILLSYGKENTLIVDGTVEALGQNGKAINFDFGKNAMGEYKEQRGSYIHFVYDYNTETKKEYSLSGIYDGHELNLNGALANLININGKVKGQNSIYIADNAYVKEINVNINNETDLSGVL